MSSANRVALRYIKEVTPGVTPATPALKAFRYTGESLNFNIDNVQTSEINPNRVETDTLQVSAAASGAVNVELSYGTFDDHLEAVLASTWVAGTGDQFNLDNGVTPSFWTIQKHFQDMAIPQFHNYQGNVFDGMNLRMEVGRIVTGDFSLMGFGAAVATAQFTGATFPAASSTSPMNAVANLQNFSIGGVPYSGCISAIAMSVKNNVRPRRCVGSLKPTDVKYGRLAITGSMEFYFNEGSNYAAFVAGTEFSISWDLVDPAGNKYTFTIPRAKFETGQVVAGGLDTDVMFSATWRALYHAGSGRVIRITRDPV